MTARGAIVSVAVSGALALAYVWASPSLDRQHWDSLAYAAACEARGPRAMWGHHPLGHPIGCGVFTAARGLGYPGRALPIMTAVNCVAAAVAVAALFVLLTTVLRAGPRCAAGWALAMGGAYAFWHFAGTAEIYGVTIVVLIVAWGIVVRSHDRPSLGSGLLSGLACGVTALCHQLAGVVVVIGALALLTARDGRGRQRLAAFGVFAAAAALTVVTGYGLLGAVATGSASAADIVRWAAGDLEASAHFFTLDDAAVALRTGASTPVPPGGPRRTRVAQLALGGSCLALLLTAPLWIRRLPSRDRAIALASALQCLVTWILIAVWEPTTRKVWLLTLPAFLTLCDLALRGLGRRRWPADAVPVLAGALLFVSSGAVMLKERQPDVGFERSLRAWVEHSRPDDVLIENGRYVAHLLFREGRPNTVNLYPILLSSAGESDRFVKLREVIARAARRNAAVLFSPALDPYYYSDARLAFVGVTRQQVLSFFDQYGREGPLFEYQASGDGAQPVYRLVGRGR